uniref:G_PROTEIN_RECEP_F1_2 domain-containing protein n=1 Tax=Steinernema glaseri TaxID=37863 RepID=A0A1I7YLW7_9BILA
MGDMMACWSDPPLFDINDTEIWKFAGTLNYLKEAYGSVHRYISIVLCVLGLLANSVHIWVLTRPQMRDSAVHAVLTCIAMADMGTMISYSIYIIRYEFFLDVEGYPYGWSMFLKLHAVMSIALHATSLYLVVLMAYIRYMAIKARYTKWMMPKLACVMSAIVAVVIFLLCIPTYLLHQAIEVAVYDENGEQRETSKYAIRFSQAFLDNHCALLKMNLWLTGIVLKAVPCFLLLGFTFALLKKLRENTKKRSALLHISEDKRSDRITYMLLLMVAVFLTTELPQGIFAVCNAVFTSHFHGLVYMCIADILDLLSLINCYVGFIVFVTTGSKYRETLMTLVPFLKSRCTSNQTQLTYKKGTTHKSKSDMIDFHRQEEHV